MTKVKKIFFFVCFQKIFFLQNLNNLFPISCLKFIKGYSLIFLKELLKNEGGDRFLVK